MTALDDFPDYISFMGMSLKNGCYIIGILSIIHSLAYGLLVFQPITYLILTIWILVALLAAASIGLIYGVYHSDFIACAIWIWYALAFVPLMMIIMIVFGVVFGMRKKKRMVYIACLGMLWVIGRYGAMLRQKYP